MATHYEILGIPENATFEDMKRAHRRLARDSHPDVCPNDPRAAERLKAVQLAFEVLSDVNRRRLYDRALKMQRLAEALKNLKETLKGGPRPPETTRSPSTPPPLEPTRPAARIAADAAPASSTSPGVAVAGALALLLAAAYASSNSWDSGAQRYRSGSSGQFRSGRWG